MKILETHDFKKPSRSHYAEAVDALVNDGVFAVRLTREEGDLPGDTTAGSASGSIRQLISKRGRVARCFIESDDALVVALQPEGTATRKKPARAKQPA